jgi:phosphoglycolate phosphatase
MGHPARDPASLNIYIGPPLQDIFGGLLNTEEAAVVRAAVTFFRERYFSVGYKENVLYPGMMDVIRELKRSGHTMYIATAKMG